MTLAKPLSLVLLMAAFWASGCVVGDPNQLPVLEAGDADSEQFRAFEVGDKMDVLTAVQTGLWLMPTLRHQGFSSEPSISCTAFDLDKDLFLAEKAAHTNSRDFEGWDFVVYSMQIQLPDAEMNDTEELLNFDGDRVLFECSATDDEGRSVAIAHEMTLAIR